MHPTAVLKIYGFVERGVLVGFCCPGGGRFVLAGMGVLPEPPDPPEPPELLLGVALKSEKVLVGVGVIVRVRDPAGVPLVFTGRSGISAMA